MLPKNRAPSHPGKILSKRFLKPLGLSQRRAADLCGFSQHRTINEICTGKRSISPETALIFAKTFNTSPELWLNLQSNYDLWHALHSERVINKLKKISPVEIEVAIA